MINIVDKQDRKKLSEGRTTQMGFAFLKKTAINQFETVQPVSPCKDYLNDVIYSEVLNQSVSACGLTYSKQGIFDGKKAYLAFKICPSNYGNSGSYTKEKLEADRKNVEANYKRIQQVINHVEEKLGVPRSVIRKANDDMFLVTLPHYWAKSTHLISLYSLLLRMAQYWNGEGEIGNFFNNYPSNMESMLWLTARKKLDMIYSGVKVVQEFDPKTGGGIHSCGILRWNPAK